MSWQFELLAGPYGGVTEGPAWDGRYLLFTHIPASRILRYDPAAARFPSTAKGPIAPTDSCSTPRDDCTAARAGLRKTLAVSSAMRKMALPS